MNTLNDLLNFARIQALICFDQLHTYDSQKAAMRSGIKNIIDTMIEHDNYDAAAMTYACQAFKDKFKELKSA